MYVIPVRGCVFEADACISCLRMPIVFPPPGFRWERVQGKRTQASALLVADGTGGIRHTPCDARARCALLLSFVSSPLHVARVSLPPRLMNGPPYTNTDFITAFAASFPGFASTLNPADTFETTIIPAWDRYKLKGRKIEMIFNRTEDGEPFIEPFSTSASLLRRCA